MSAELGAHGTILCLLVAEALLRGVRTRLLLPRGAGLSLWQAVEGNAYGEVASAVTPGRVGGEPARFFGYRRFGVDSLSAVVALAVERVIGWVLIGMVAVILVAALGGDGYRGAIQLASGLGAVRKWLVPVIVLMAACAAVVLWYHKRHRTTFKSGLAARVSLSFKELPKSHLLLAAAITLVSIVARTSILPILLIPMDIEVNMGAVILGSFTLIYSQLVLPTPSGAGGVELGFAAGFAVLPPAELAGLLITWRVYTLVLGAAFGGVLLLRYSLSRKKLVKVAAVILLLSVCASSWTSAQEDLGSRTLPTDHWAYEYVKHLRGRGFLSNLNPLVQPYRRLDVARDLSKLDADTLPMPLKHWVGLLRREFQSEIERIGGGTVRQWGVKLEGGSRASSTQRLDPLRPIGNVGLWPNFRAGVWVENGAFSGEVRISGDLYWNYDPDGLDPGEKFGGRTDNAYVAIAFPQGGFAVGRIPQNWSALGTTGLMVSDESFTYPRATLELGLGKFRLRAMAGELDTLLGRKRYLIAHRFDYESPSLVLSLGESILYAPHQSGFSLRYLNPVEVLLFDRELEPNDQTVNVTLDAQLWYHGGWFQCWFEGFLDDVSVYRGDESVAPTRYALTLGARLLPAVSHFEVGLDYERVSSFAYRTNRGIDHYSFLQRGLGANYADYDRLTGTLDLFTPLPGLRVTPTLQFQRQGQGGLRVPFPDYTVFRTSPALFLGVKETTYRLGLRGRYQPNRYFWLAWDVGENFVRNARHVEGDDIWEFGAVGELGVRLDLPLRRSN